MKQLALHIDPRVPLTTFNYDLVVVVFSHISSHFLVGLGMVRESIELMVCQIAWNYLAY